MNLQPHSYTPGQAREDASDNTSLSIQGSTTRPSIHHRAMLVVSGFLVLFNIWYVCLFASVAEYLLGG